MKAPKHAARRNQSARHSPPEALESRIAPAAFIVTSMADSGAGTLRAAIDDANTAPGADTISFKKAGKIKLLSDLPDITDDLSIAATKTVKIDGLASSQIFSIVGAGVDVTLDRLQLLRGKAVTGGAIAIDADGGSLALRSVKIKSSTASTTGGGTALGGALAIFDGAVTIENSTLSGNRAEAADGTAHGGAIYNAGTLTISGSSKITANAAVALDAAGGAIFNAAGATLSLTNSTLAKNLAQGTNGLSGEDGANGANGAKGGRGEDGEDGGDAEPGGDGTDGGSARGGGIFNMAGAAIRNSVISGNFALGGNGGAGGNGGRGGNGGAGGPGYVYDGYRYPGGSAGYAGAGGDGGSGGIAGEARGGGIHNEVIGTVTIEGGGIQKNAAIAGLGGEAGTGGSRGGGRNPGDANGAAGLPGVPGMNAGGGGIWSSGSVDISEGAAISMNTVRGTFARGGGIASEGGGSLSVDDSVISKNSVTARDGRKGPAGEKGENGSAGGRGEDGEDGGEGSPGENGEDGGDAFGGGIFSGAGIATIRRSTITGNTTTSGNGGAGGAGGNGGNGGAGGPAYTYDGYHYPAGAAGYGGNSGDGGHGGNAGAAGGGGIYGGAAGSVTISSSTIAKNKVLAGKPGAAGSAGAIGSGKGTAEKGVAGEPGDTSRADGGGVFSKLGTLSISQATIALNIAAASGGGIAVDSNTATAIHNSTISKNTARTGGGLFVLLNGTDPVNVISTIIARNNAATGVDVSGTINADFSLIQDIGGAAITGASNIVGADPKLGALKNNGGPTQTILPSRTSPTLNSGANPDILAEDQRGQDRERGAAIDIGAVEAG